MFRYLTVLLLFTAYSSLGLPVQNNAVSVASSLQQLSSQCENSFVSKKLLENLSYCNDSMKLHSKKEIMCLMYYDINRQLCASKLGFDDDTNNKINEIQERKTLCGVAQTWTFGNIPEYPEYAKVANMIFKNQEKCLGACAVVDDIVSDDSNYYCKYYNWGMSVLNQPVANMESKMNDIQVEIKPSNTSITTSTVNNSPKVSPEETSDNLKPPVNIPLESSSVPVLNVSQKSDSPLAIPLPDMTSNKNVPKPEQEEPPLKVKEEEKETPKDIIEKPQGAEKENIDNSQLKPQSFDMDEDPEDDERDDDGLSEGLGANDPDGDDQSFNSDPKIELEKPKISEKRIEAITSFNGDIGQREIFPNMQETFTEDDDHFFPFFMTAIIVVVLLYILYHNKNKFTKVILGLIVEGRQGRRRNSRGHAYRRLDTLEQAMSSSSAAPPSKIIY
ncbi:trans-Golgi network integral membrane protein 2-like [Aricia agestis]|uniref:trans-Golgi network integral membrane protein 2-like n=1 Tax=Aricia agestis TaxID=91739 RepID=UPI001C20532A|nr:trans-Golgi network integral membrane protein 2-like [Aricia agestis]